MFNCFKGTLLEFLDHKQETDLNGNFNFLPKALKQCVPSTKFVFKFYIVELKNKTYVLYFVFLCLEYFILIKSLLSKTNQIIFI